MNGYLHVIGNKSNREYLEKQIILFSDYCYAELIRITESAYWKDERCIEFSAELKFKQYDYESVIKSATHFLGKEEDIICIEQQENIEVGMYTPIQDIVQNNKLFFTLYITANSTTK